MKLRKSRFNKILIVLSLLITFYLIICTCLYFFEPTTYNSPNLNDYNYYFELYNKYDVSDNSDFYIKQITADDIVVSDDDKRIKYVDNTILAVAETDQTFDEVTTLLNEYNCQISGYISEINFYQITFYDDHDHDELLFECEKLTESDVFRIAIPDYFEETPVSESTTDDYIADKYYYEMLDLKEAWAIYKNTSTVNIGVIDFYIDYSNEFLNIANKDEYSTDILYDDYYGGSYGSSAAHGTHVAGIIGAAHDSKAPGVINNATIYSYNGINVSTSYWIANLCDMIVNNNVKAVNISMSYNPYIIMSASLGCENAVNHIENEKILFSAILSNMIDDGHEFVICAAAGNENTKSAYRIFGGYFSYGDKKILSSLDIFSIFDKNPDFVDAKYTYLFSSPVNSDVADRTIVVGAIDSFGQYCSFSNLGDVDIAAPGKYIYSTVIDSQYSNMTGTSMATPFVTGTAAMLFSVEPDLTGAEVKDIIINSATDSVSADGFTYPVLNIGNAVRTVSDLQQNIDN